MQMPSRSFLIQQATLNAIASRFPLTLSEQGFRVAAHCFTDLPKEYPYTGEQQMLRDVGREFRKLVAQYEIAP